MGRDRLAWLVAAILFLICAVFGAWAGWKTAPDLTRRGTALYAGTANTTTVLAT